MPNLSVASFRFQPLLGEAVATYGFPYSGVLSSSGNFTWGNITALSGMQDDTRFLQTSTPIQPGNSGGPLLDSSGRVVGVVVTQLDAMVMMQTEHSVPQNVNFAIQSPIVINFLSAKSVTPNLDNSSTGAERPPSEVADMAKKFTVQIYCQGVAPKTATGTAGTLALSPSDVGLRCVNSQSAFEDTAPGNGECRIAPGKHCRVLHLYCQWLADVITTDDWTISTWRKSTPASEQRSRAVGLACLGNGICPRPLAALTPNGR